MANKSLSIYDKQLELFADPNTVETICVHISNGGSLLDLCKMWKIPYGRVTHWLRSDRSREKPYQAAMNDRQEWYREAILRELRFMATSDVRDIFTDDGCIKPTSDWSDEIASCVQSVDVTEEFQGKGAEREFIGVNKKIKLWSKDKSLELIGKYLQMFTQRIEIDGALTLAEMVNASIDIKVEE
jgi:hypothetical protein